MFESLKEIFRHHRKNFDQFSSEEEEKAPEDEKRMKKHQIKLRILKMKLLPREKKINHPTMNLS